LLSLVIKLAVNMTVRFNARRPQIYV